MQSSQQKILNLEQQVCRLELELNALREQSGAADMSKNSFAALKQSQERYRSMIRNSTDSLWRLEIEPPVCVDLPVAEQAQLILERAIMAECNDRCARDHGRSSAEEICGQKYRSLLGNPQRVLPLLESFVREGYRAVDLAGESDTAQGKKHWLNNANGICNDEGLVRIWGRHQDVSTQEETRRRLRESEARMRILAENAPTGIFRNDLEGRVTYANSKAEELCGISLDEALGKSVGRYLHPDDEERIRLAWEKAVADSAEFCEEYRFLHPNGKLVWVIGQASPVPGPDGNALYYIGTLTNITQRRRMESELLKMQKLESVGLLAGGIAHDFNNLLTAVLGNLSLAEVLLKGESGQIRAALAQAQSACKRAGRLTGQLLTFSKGGAPVTKNIKLATIVDEAARFALHGSAVALKLDLQQDLPPVKADEEQIYQVIHNLCINAVQAMDGKGCITIDAQAAELEERDVPGLAPGKWVHIRVKDTGPGVSAGNLERVFDPYFTTKKFGIGLGLASAYNILKGHGGLLSVQSVSGCGATFELWLPLAQSPSEPGVTENADCKCPHGLRILVMDDDPDIRQLMSELLVLQGLTVDLASEGTEVLEFLRAGREFDVVFLDLTIPGGMGGRSTAQSIKKDFPELKLVVMSGYSTDPVMAQPAEYGFCARLCKPFRLDELCQVILELWKSPQGC